MKQFRKKPVAIEAVQFTPEACWDFWLNNKRVFGHFSVSGNYHPERREISSAWIYIETLEGTMRAELGDWIIKGIKGEFYPCKPDIFAATYEPADAEDPKDARISKLETALRSVFNKLDTLIAESDGVAGLHRNGDIADWQWLQDNGWLDLTEERAVLEQDETRQV